jgi:hypothetical protein
MTSLIFMTTNFKWVLNATSNLTFLSSTYWTISCLLHFPQISFHNLFPYFTVKMDTTQRPSQVPTTPVESELIYFVIPPVTRDKL